MSPRLRILGALGVLVLVLVACNGETVQAPAGSPPATAIAPSALERYENPVLGFAISYPTDWRVEEAVTDPAAGVGEVAFFAPHKEGDTFDENLVVSVADAPDEADLQDIVDSDALALRAAVPGFTVLGVGPATLGGEEGASVAFTGTPDDVAVSFLRAVVLHEGKVYALTFAASAEEFDAYRPLAEQLFDTFTFVNP